MSTYNDSSQIQLEQINPFINALRMVSNLDINQAKTIVYYCICTWYSTPNCKPLLNLNGETGTGKNAIMEQIKDWCCRPKWIKAENLTTPRLRDELANSGTAFIEEVDKVQNLKECEMLLKMRYDKTSQSISYNVQRASSKQQNYNTKVTTNHFGYTIMHTQNPFQAIELDRRIIQIDILKDTAKEYSQPQTNLDCRVLKQVADNIDWNCDVYGSGAAFDCWLPILRVAGYLGDNEYMDYVFKCIDNKTEESNLSKVFEPKGIVLSEIIPGYLRALDSSKTKIPITIITSNIRNRRLSLYPDERQVVAFTRQLGFEVYYPGNKAHIKVTTREALEAIVSQHGLGDEVLEHTEE